MKSIMRLFTVIVLIPAFGCMSGASNSAPGDLTAEETASDQNPKTYILDNAIVSDEKRTVTMTTSGDGTPGSPISVDFDFGDPEATKTQN